MDSVFGITGKDFVVVVCDMSQARSIVIMKSDEDKTVELDSHKLFGVSGENGDRINFCEFIKKNLKLYEIRNDYKLSTYATANFTRQELATALRKNPYNVNLLLAGWEEEVGPSLYYIDYLASMHPVKYAAHGYASYFLSGLLDKYWENDMSRGDALDLVKKCISELRTRFMVNASQYIIKIVGQEGIEKVELE